MEELVEYFQDKDKKFCLYLQEVGQARAHLLELIPFLKGYIEDLSPDAVPSPDFINEFRNKVLTIYKELEYS
jgi:hypothetical protein